MSSDKIENVLILQGGGSLGAFGCGVFKALANNNIKIKIDIVAGTSIGGLNATIIAGSKGTKVNLYCHLCVEHNNKEKSSWFPRKSQVFKKKVRFFIELFTF